MSKRRKLFALVTVLLATLASVAIGAPAQAAGFTPLRIWNSSHCIDNATEDDAKLQMWNCTGGSEQKWLRVYDSDTGYFMFTNQHTGLCMTAPLFEAGTVAMAGCDTSDYAQQWLVYHSEYTWAGWYYVWQHVGSGDCMSTPSVGNGTLIQTTECDPYARYYQWQMQ